MIYWHLTTNYGKYLMRCTKDQLHAKQYEYLRLWREAGHNLGSAMFSYRQARMTTLSEIKMPSLREVQNG